MLARWPFSPGSGADDARFLDGSSPAAHPADILATASLTRWNPFLKAFISSWTPRADARGQARQKGGR